MRLHIRRDKIKNVVRISLGVFAVFVTCLSFSGFSFEIKNIDGVISRLIVSSNPVVDTVNRLSYTDGARTLACTYFMEDYIPLDVSLLAGQKNGYSDVNVGEISVVVGDSKYTLYERVIDENDEVSGNIELVNGDSYSEKSPKTGNKNAEKDNVNSEDAVIQAMSGRIANESDILAGFKEDHTTKYLLKNFYIIDSTTSVKNSLFNVDKMLSKDFKIDKSKNDAPQILIYHTHAASEGFSDSRQGDIEDGIVGIGNDLAKVLEETYGYRVYHDKTPYDMINGKIDRSAAYAKALPVLKQRLAEYPSIKLIIDLHRDGVGSSDKSLTIVNGEKTARAMFFNGLSRNSVHKIKYLKNEHLFGNLAFSLQLKLKAMELYPDFTKPIYLKGYRYNLHLLPRSLLIELGNQNNTVQEAKNAAAPLADIIDAVLSGR